MAQTDVEIRQAEARMIALREAGHAVAARHDAATGMVVLQLSTGVQLAVPAVLIEGLSDASPQQLAEIEISPSGLGLHWPQLDADVYLPGLLQGLFGSASWSASQLGRTGGFSRSAAKASAARENGRKGGRPRKSKVPSAA